MRLNRLSTKRLNLLPEGTAVTYDDGETLRTPGVIVRPPHLDGTTVAFTIGGYSGIDVKTSGRFWILDEDATETFTRAMLKAEAIFREPFTAQ